MRDLFRRRATLVAIFESRPALLAAMDHLLAEGLGGMLDIGHAALIVRTGGEPPAIINNNVTAREAWVAGAIGGAAMLALGCIQYGALDLPGPQAFLAVALAAAAGAALGALAGAVVANRITFGFRDVLLQSTAAELESGQVALLLQVRPGHLAALRAKLVELQARIGAGTRAA
jgi:hypothetical protein